MKEKDDYMAYKEAYIAFMSNPDNIGKCESCPANRGFKNYSPDFKLPCGQQVCHVRITCEAYGTLPRSTRPIYIYPFPSSRG